MSDIDDAELDFDAQRVVEACHRAIAAMDEDGGRSITNSIKRKDIARILSAARRELRGGRAFATIRLSDNELALVKAFMDVS